MNKGDRVVIIKRACYVYYKDEPFCSTDCAGTHATIHERIFDSFIFDNFEDKSGYLLMPKLCGFFFTNDIIRLERREIVKKCKEMLF